MPISKVGSKGVKDASLSADDLATGSVTNDKLAGSIANDKLANSNITINGTAINLGASGDIVAGTDWQSVKTADFTAVASEGYFVNTTGGAITVTLPASPSIGDEIHIRDYAGTFATNNITLNRNGEPLAGVAANGTLDTNNILTTLVYVDSTKGWLAVENEAKANVVPATYVTATGGTLTTSGDYKIHVFNSSSNFVVSDAGNNQGSNTVSYLVVAGGASGGNGGTPGSHGGAGGGGAGGYRESKSTFDSYTSPFPGIASGGLTVSAQTYPVTVGGGGATVTSAATDGNPGSNSVFSTITSAGGGGGARGLSSDSNPNSINGLSGGSGGGAGGGGNTNNGGDSGSGGAGNTPPVSPSQGSNGGGTTEDGGQPGIRMGGGGGGATAIGGEGGPGSHPTGAGDGGAGATSEISGSAVVRAGGGGGADGNSCVEGAGGSGGGGTGGKNQADATAGSANTGGGGGGGGDCVVSRAGIGAAGGSGVVIIRYKFQN